MSKLHFSGHNSFICKQFWLKKGYDFLRTEGNNFNSDESVVALGIGKNMVAALRYWLISFNIYKPADEKDDGVTSLGNFLFRDGLGKDPYLEDINSIWLLHYFLVKTNYATIYNLAFNSFFPQKQEFKAAQLQKFIKRFCESEKQKISPNTLKRDVQVFLQSYQPASQKIKEIEDSFSGLLHELNLLTIVRSEDGEKLYSFQYTDREELAEEIVLYVILDIMQEGESSISFKRLLSNPNSPAWIFGLNADGLLNKITALTNKYPGITYSETAGNRVLQFEESMLTPETKQSILEDYYK
ncbi:DUF4007 family protein [Saprospira grandis]|uniref:DUF4007 family protein n=1 Tax=Saprospira grandis TaxID=1008 RepID=UPI0022DDC917|nr:DUF4007 family protein [Saprospira grandis]WBM73637.1 DUF4007 family protein [Saprospira grandis]